MKSARPWFLGIAGVLLSLLASGEVGAQTMRWDLISITSFNPVTIVAGGHDSALANDGSKITLTGSGSFDLAEPDNVTGGGEWMLLDPKSSAVGKGTYQVTGFLRFTEAPGTPNPANVDKIGRKEDFRAGLAILRIAYSDGSRGILMISCAAGATSPPQVSEGISASKGFVLFSLEKPTAGVDGNRTTFHIVR